MDTMLPPDMENMKTEETDKKREITKVIYFDETSATDYMTIVNGGNLEYVSQFSQDIMKKMGKNTQVKGSVSFTGKNSVSQLLESMFTLSSQASGEAQAEFAMQSARIFKYVLQNTILSDFIVLGESEDSHIRVFHNCLLKIPGISDTQDSEKSDQDAFGYYQLTGRYKGKKSEGVKKCIFRFNRSCFRNNYRLNDLKHMKLTIYAVCVGRGQQPDGTEILDMYDAFLAGVK